MWTDASTLLAGLIDPAKSKVADKSASRSCPPDRRGFA